MEKETFFYREAYFRGNHRPENFGHIFIYYIHTADAQNTEKAEKKNIYARVVTQQQNL